MSKLTAYETVLVASIQVAYGVSRGVAMARLFPRKATKSDRLELANKIKEWKAMQR